MSTFLSLEHETPIVIDLCLLDTYFLDALGEVCTIFLEMAKLLTKGC